MHHRFENLYADTELLSEPILRGFSENNFRSEVPYFCDLAESLSLR
jgi:hypothetical protein